MNRDGRNGYLLTMSDPLIWWQETRRCGLAAAVLPVVIAGAVVAMAVALRGEGAAVGNGMVRVSAIVFPLGCGLAATAALGRERLIELQVSVRTPYRFTVTRRLVVITTFSTLGAVAMVVGLHGAGLWRHPAGGAPGLLVPMGPSLFLIGVAAWASAVLRFNGGAGAAVVVGAWVFEVFIWGNYVALWQLNTGLLLVVGVLAAVRGVRLLDNSERLITGRPR